MMVRLDLPHAWSRQHQMLIAIAVAAVLVRCVSAIYLGDTIQSLPGIADQVSYDQLARSVISGHGFTFPVDWWPATRAGQPTAHWSFLYTLYLAGVYSVAGWHPLVARLIQAVIAGALYPLLVWRLGRRFFGAEVGIAAALLIALYGYFVYYAGALMTETFYILAVLWALDLSMRIAGERPTAKNVIWLKLGLALGLAVLLRQLILLFVPLLFVWLIWSTALRRTKRLPEVRSVIFGLAAATAVLAVMIAPWTIRNYHAFGRPVLLNTNAGYAFFWANHPLQGTDFVPIFPSNVYYEMIPKELLHLDEAALESALMQRGVQFVIDDPRRYALLSVSRVKDYFEFWPSADSSSMSNVARVFSFGLYLPLFLYGVMMSLTQRRLIRSGQGASVALVCLFVVSYTAIHLLSWALVRYRLPIDAVMMPFAGLALVKLLRFAHIGFLQRLVDSANPQHGLVTARARRVLQDRNTP